MELKKGYVLKQSDLKEDCELIKQFNKVDYLVWIKDRRYLVHKEGKCDYKKCNSACCKLISEHIFKYSALLTEI